MKTRSLTNVTPNQIYPQSGYVAVVLLVFVVVAVVLAGAAVSVNIANTASTVSYSTGTQALLVAESGAENALLRLLRDPEYAGETFLVGSGSATINVTGDDPIIVTSVGELGMAQRTIQVQVERVNGVMSINSWDEL